MSFHAVLSLLLVFSLKYGDQTGCGNLHEIFPKLKVRLLSADFADNSIVDISLMLFFFFFFNFFIFQLDIEGHFVVNFDFYIPFNETAKYLAIPDVCNQLF